LAKRKKEKRDGTKIGRLQIDQLQRGENYGSTRSGERSVVVSLSIHERELGMGYLMI